MRNRLTRDVTVSRETESSGANGDMEISIFPVQLTTSRIGNLTRLIHPLLKVMTTVYMSVVPSFYPVCVLDGNPLNGAAVDQLASFFFSTHLLSTTYCEISRHQPW